jgi:head-tail adaptor
MDPGQLTRRILLRLWADSANAAFGLDANYDAGRHLFAKVEPIHSLALRAGMNTDEVPTHLFWIRYTPETRPEDITTSHVIEWYGRRYRVLGAINVQDEQIFTRITAKDLGAIP